MTRLDELKELIKTMFENSTDTDAIKQSAVVMNKLTEVEAENTKQQEDYKSLLNDYKDAVLHTSVKTENASTEPVELREFDADDYTAKFLANLK